MNILNGKQLSLDLNLESKKEIEKDQLKISLSIIQVGDNPASNIYVRNKVKACTEAGINAQVHHLSEDCSEHEIINLITELNYNPVVTGIMVQLPLPSHLDEDKILNVINPQKDVDGLTTINIGKLHSGKTCLNPCTPAGIIKLLDCNSIPIEGKRVLIIGRSNIVGKPVAAMFTQRNATVTIAHSKTHRSDLLRLFATSDIVVTAVGKSNFITEEDADQYWKDWRHDYYCSFSTIRERVIIDVGINRDENGKLCGDLSEDFKKKYSAHYTPVPGGVGPMTICMLIKNCIQAASEKLDMITLNEDNAHIEEETLAEVTYEATQRAYNKVKEKCLTLREETQTLDTIIEWLNSLLSMPYEKEI